MESLSFEAFLLTIIFSFAANVILGGLILFVLARAIGKISEATFFNSIIICFLAGIIYLIVFAAIWLFFDYGIGANMFYRTLYDMGNLVAFIFLSGINFITLSIAYVVLAKFMWKTSWQQTFLASVVWVVVVVILLAFPSFLLIRKANKVSRDILYPGSQYYEKNINSYNSKLI
jgi:hypothetical protein